MSDSATRPPAAASPAATPAASPLHSLPLPLHQRAMLAAMGIHWHWPDPPIPATPTRPPAPAKSPPAPSAPLPPAPPRDPEIRATDTEPTSGEPLFDPQPIALLDWASLRARIHACQACPLGRGRQQAVVGMGPERARWMVVGEAPGEQEDLQGLPFVGPAGQLLDAMLAAMGLSRQADVYVANVIKCRPPRNRNPEPAEIARCQPYLLRQIELVQPALILALGRFAAQALLAEVVPDVHTQPLGRLRGRIYSAHGRAIVVSYHPAYLLRNPIDKRKAWADLCLAMAHLGHTPPLAAARRAPPPPTETPKAPQTPQTPQAPDAS